MTGEGFKLTSAADGVVFDIAVTGHPVRTALIAPDSHNAWLVLDRNGNGVIDDGSELFGNRTDQPNPRLGEDKNGFLALAVFDQAENGGNGDGLIDTRDSVFSRLRLWQDANHNGKSEPGELHSLSELGITVIDLKYHTAYRKDASGNVFRWRARVLRERETDVSPWAWDVILQIMPN